MEVAQNPSGSENCPKIRQVVVIHDHERQRDWPGVITATKGSVIDCIAFTDIAFTAQSQIRLLGVHPLTRARIQSAPAYTWRAMNSRDYWHQAPTVDLFNAAFEHARQMEKAAAAKAAYDAFKAAAETEPEVEQEPCPCCDEREAYLQERETEHQRQMASVTNAFLDALRALCTPEAARQIADTAEKIRDMTRFPDEYVRKDEVENDWHGRWRSVVGAMDEILPKKQMEAVLKRAESGGYS